MTLKVFVFTSVYNDEKNIKESIQSILSQTYKNFKYFIINDGSTDNTKKEIEEAILGDSRVSFINLKKNIGIVENRNNLFKLNFDYALIQDSDDISHPKRIETQVKFMEAHKNVIASGAFLNIINEEGKIIGNRKYNLNDNEIRNQFFSSCPDPIIFTWFILFDKSGNISINKSTPFLNVREPKIKILNLFFLKSLSVC